MNKINFKTYLLLSIFLFTGFIITVITYKHSEEKTLINLNKGYISRNSIEFDLQEINSNNILQFKSINDFENNITIYANIDKYIKGVYFTGKGIVPPIYEGSFFSDIDFLTNKNIAVIGKNVDIDKEEEGNKYIRINDEYFRVVGYTGINDSSLLDNMIYIPINENDYISSGSYVLEGYNSHENYLDLVDRLNDGFIMNKFNTEDIFNNRTLDNSIINNSSDFIMWCIFIMSMVSITYYIVKQYEKKIYILKVCGISYFNIFRNCFIKNIILSILGFSLGFIIGVVTISYKSDGYVFKHYLLSLKNIYLNSILTYFIPMILFALYFIKKELRGEKKCHSQ